MKPEMLFLHDGSKLLKKVYFEKIILRWVLKCKAYMIQ